VNAAGEPISFDDFPIINSTVRCPGFFIEHPAR
jgi:hypothetical protein